MTVRAIWGEPRSSWYYQRSHLRTRRPESEEVDQRDAIERGSYCGVPRLGLPQGHPVVPHKRQGWTINHKKVLRVMRKESLVCQLKRRFNKPTTDSSSHPLKTYPNLIKDTVVSAPERAWSADITYIRLCPQACVSWPRSSTSTLATARGLGTTQQMDRYEAHPLCTWDGPGVSLSSRRVDPPLRSGCTVRARGEYIANLEQIRAHRSAWPAWATLTRTRRPRASSGR
jgi:hypothetical protein